MNPLLLYSHSVHQLSTSKHTPTYTKPRAKGA